MVADRVDENKEHTGKKRNRDEIAPKERKGENKRFKSETVAHDQPCMDVEILEQSWDTLWDIFDILWIIIQRIDYEDAKSLSRTSTKLQMNMYQIYTSPSIYHIPVESAIIMFEEQMLALSRNWPDLQTMIKLQKKEEIEAIYCSGSMFNIIPLSIVQAGLIQSEKWIGLIKYPSRENISETHRLAARDTSSMLSVLNCARKYTKDIKEKKITHQDDTATITCKKVKPDEKSILLEKFRSLSNTTTFRDDVDVFTHVIDDIVNDRFQINTNVGITLSLIKNQNHFKTKDGVQLFEFGSAFMFTYKEVLKFSNLFNNAMLKNGSKYKIIVKSEMQSKWLPPTNTIYHQMGGSLSRTLHTISDMTMMMNSNIHSEEEDVFKISKPIIDTNRPFAILSRIFRICDNMVTKISTRSRNNDNPTFTYNNHNERREFGEKYGDLFGKFSTFATTSWYNIIYLYGIGSSRTLPVECELLSCILNDDNVKLNRICGTNTNGKIEYLLESMSIISDIFAEEVLIPITKYDPNNTTSETIQLLKRLDKQTPVHETYLSTLSTYYMLTGICLDDTADASFKYRLFRQKCLDTNRFASNIEFNLCIILMVHGFLSL